MIVAQRFAIILLLCLTIASTTEAWRRIRIRVRRFISRVGETLCKEGLKVVGCNVAGTVGCAVGTAVGNKNCRKKRSTDVQLLDEGMTYYPLPDDFEEYDDNKDGVIEYEELAADLLSRWTFTHPEQLRGLFMDADDDDDGYLDEAEFSSAPWNFGSYEVKVEKTPIIEPIQDDE